MPKNALHHRWLKSFYPASAKTGISVDRIGFPEAAVGNLSARDVDELITATSDAQGSLAFVARLLQFEELGLMDVH